MMRIRCYTELSEFHSHKERYDYLRARSSVGTSTFGFERYLNQRFYTSTQWRHVRRIVIARDYGCDLGIRGYEIHDKIIIHHMNPMTVEQVTEGNESILDPEFLISVSAVTHNAIHFGDSSLLVRLPIARQPGDTKLW